MSKTYFDKPSDTAVATEEYAYVEPISHRAMKSILSEAETAITGDRNESYGPPEKNHARTAEAFNWYLKHCGKTLDGYDVAMLNILQKISRNLHCRKRDGLVDIAGYCANAAACQAADLPLNGT